MILTYFIFSNIVQVIYDRSPVAEGKLSITDDDYTEADTVYVLSLQQFFGNKFVGQRIAHIKKLKICGLDEDEFRCDIKFNDLIHLELSNVLITNATIFESPKLEKLLVSNAYLYTTAGASHHFHHLGLGSLTSQLKYCRTTDILPPKEEVEFYNAVLKSPMFWELETLDCHLMSFKTLIYISNNFKQLKTVNVRFATCRDDMIHLLDKGLKKLLSKLRPNLTVNFFGIPLNNETVEMVESFFNAYLVELDLGPDSVAVKFCHEWNEFSNNFGQHAKLLSGFFKLVDTVIFEDQAIDSCVLDRFSNVTQACFKFWLDVKHGLPDRLKSYSNIKHLQLNSFPDAPHYHNDILDMIPVHCSKLLSLHIDIWDTDVDTNYRFLLDLTSIKVIRIFTRLPFDRELYMDLLRRLTHLSFLEIWYEMTENVTKDELSSFKQAVKDCIENELGFGDSDLSVQIHRRTSYFGEEKYAFVRIVMKRVALDSAHNLMLASEGYIRKMMWCIGYKREHPESSDEVNRIAVRYGRKASGGD